ncbi:hypothetical protein TNCV_2726281 [Trichonephila clavipes]|nr:hypothetical protein TNCV_2726281 [Trichonephila clavipes]
MAFVGCVIVRDDFVGCHVSDGLVAFTMDRWPRNCCGSPCTAKVTNEGSFYGEGDKVAENDTTDAKRNIHDGSRGGSKAGQTGAGVRFLGRHLD